MKRQEVLRSERDKEHARHLQAIEELEREMYKENEQHVYVTVKAQERKNNGTAQESTR